VIWLMIAVYLTSLFSAFCLGLQLGYRIKAEER